MPIDIDDAYALALNTKLMVMKVAERFAEQALACATEAGEQPWWNKRRAWRLVGESMALQDGSETRHASRRNHLRRSPWAI